MNILTKTLVILILSLCGISSSNAAPRSITERLRDRNQISLQTEKVYSYIFNQEVRERMAYWGKHPKNRDYMKACRDHLSEHLQSRNVVTALCYLLKQKDPARRAIAKDVLTRYVSELKLATLEISEDPRYSDSERSKALGYYQAYSQANMSELHKCFDYALRGLLIKGNNPDSLIFAAARSCMNHLGPQIGNETYLKTNFVESFGFHPGHVVSETGWIGGNRVTYLADNDHSEELQKQLESRMGLVDRLYPFQDRGSVKSMVEAIKRGEDVFSEAEGFYTFEQHPVWTQKSGIFAEIVKALDGAQESIFFDVFFLGGNNGGFFS